LAKNSSIVLGGAQDFLSLSSPLPTLNSITLSFWVKLANTAYKSNLLTLFSNTADFRFYIGWQNGNFLYTYYELLGNAITDESIYERSIDTSIWFNQVVQVSGTKITLFLNGKQLSWPKLEVNYNLGRYLLGDLFYLGSKNEGGVYAAFDDIAVYNRILSQREIQQIFDE